MLLRTVRTTRRTQGPRTVVESLERLLALALRHAATQRLETDAFALQPRLERVQRLVELRED